MLFADGLAFKSLCFVFAYIAGCHLYGEGKFTVQIRGQRQHTDNERRLQEVLTRSNQELSYSDFEGFSLPVTPQSGENKLFKSETEIVVVCL